MFEAARVDDEIGHSHAMAGMIAGTLVGGMIAAADGIPASALMAGIAVAGIIARPVDIVSGQKFLNGYKSSL